MSNTKNTDSEAENQETKAGETEKISPLTQGVKGRIDTEEFSEEQEDGLDQNSETAEDSRQDEIDKEDEDFAIEDLEKEDLSTETSKMPVDSNLTDLGASFIVDGAFKFLPSAACSISEFDTKKTLALELKGDLEEGYTEHFKTINAENLEKLESQLALVKPFVDEPLAKLAEKKALKFEPETILMYIGIGLVLFLVYQTYSVRKSNKQLLASLVAKRKVEKEIEANLQKVTESVLEEEEEARGLVPKAAPKEDLKPKKDSKDDG